jgi:hypothetical protein
MSGNDAFITRCKQIDDLQGQAMLLPPGIKPDRPDRLASILTQGFILPTSPRSHRRAFRWDPTGTFHNLSGFTVFGRTHYDA